MPKTKAKMETAIEDIKDKSKPKRPYTRPKLIVHGTVKQITKAVGTKGTDGLTGSRVG